MRVSSVAVVVALGLAVASAASATPPGGSGQVRYAVSARQGFDTCQAPSVQAMGNFWSGPFWDTIIYVGGVNRGCPQPNLTPNWVVNVHNDGFWDFYLTWVGLQASCSGFANRMSSDPATAARQGRDAADSAVAAARSLGFTGKNVYYFDLEGYDTGNSACRTAAANFVTGWVTRLHNYWGEKAGVYGSACASAVDDWAYTGNPPDDVWAADWNGDPDVWGLGCIPNGHWVYQQRIHQWRGGHKETWNGTTLNIDSDCTDGWVTPHGHYTSGDPACVNE
jgi:Domain of unknown function (DUF1906)